MFVEHKEAGEVKELDSTSKLLLDAANLIELRGWCQNSLKSNGRMCILGALDVAAGNKAHALDHPRLRDVMNAAHRFAAVTGRPASWFNDDQGRTKEEVVAKLRAVALGG